MEKSFENGYALVIGISKYLDKRINELQYTHADAQAFSKLLTDPERMGLKNENVKILLDEKATLSKIKEAFAIWLKKADEKSTVFIFFAGHGGWETDHFSRDKDSKASYFLPYDTNRDSFYASAFSSQDLDNALKMIRSKKLIIFLDSCHSGGVASGTRDVKCEEDPYKKLAEGEGRVIISASKPDQLSYEGSSLGHGVFTYHLIEALSGKADTDKNGYVTVFEVFDYLQKNVPASARDLPNGGQQEPMIKNENIARDFSISINPILIEKENRKSIQEEKIRKLRQYLNNGKISGKQYERLRTIIKTENEKLQEKDLIIGRLTDSFLEGDVSLDTFLEDLEDIEKGHFPDVPVRPGHVQIRGEKPVNDDEKKKDEAGARQNRIIELDREAKTLGAEGNHAQAITKWKEILELEPENVKAKEGLRESQRIIREINELNVYAQRLADEGMHDRALEKWNEVLTIDVNNKIALEGISNTKKTISDIKSTKVSNICPNCGHHFEAGWKFCETCGFHLNQNVKKVSNYKTGYKTSNNFCPNCRKQFSPDDIYCENCGVKLI